MMKVFEHEHPLKLVDLQEKLKESDDEEEEEFVIQDEFLFSCKRCGQEIKEYHRYYYKCVLDDSCVYHLHKICAELPTTLEHTSHSHPLTRCQSRSEPPHYVCHNCLRLSEAYEVYYICSDSCLFTICLNCVVKKDTRRMYHPSHPHPLVSLLSKPILWECDACGKEHKGVFFQCTTCFDFAIHTDCIKLPQRLLIQTTNDIYHHTHPLTLSYSFPSTEQRSSYFPKCRVCNAYFSYRHWIYKCDKCMYYTHVDCATSRREAFMSIVYKDKVTPTVKNFVDADYPRLLNLPFPDETCSIQKHLFSKETRPTTDEVSSQLINHQHDLVLVDTKYIDSLGGSTSSKSNSLIMCHDPMKKIQLVCDACLRPIMEMPFYKCGANCNFVIHEWCTRLPSKVDNHPGHPQHTLVLMPNAPHVFLNIFHCGACSFPCNGYAYVCLKCKYYVDVTCAFIPENITHKSHPCHLLSRVKEIPKEFKCHMCLLPVCFDIFKKFDFSAKLMGFGCSVCDVYIHLGCALLLPETIRHAYDKHPMRLSYLPIENHKSEYFCEICENTLNPNYCFYHCKECAQSVHSACAPLILNCETNAYSILTRNVYMHLNVKFGGTHKTDGHPHPLTLAPAIAADGRYFTNDGQLPSRMILKCTECEFVVDFDSWKKANHSSSW